MIKSMCFLLGVWCAAAAEYPDWAEQKPDGRWGPKGINAHFLASGEKCREGQLEMIGAPEAPNWCEWDPRRFHGSGFELAPVLGADDPGYR